MSSIINYYLIMNYFFELNSYYIYLYEKNEEVIIKRMNSNSFLLILAYPFGFRDIYEISF